MNTKSVTKVKVGAFVYKIHNTEEATTLHNAMGCCQKDQLKIFLSDKFPDQVKKETLLHEVLHAIFHISNVMSGVSDNDTDDELMKKEEHLITTISPILFETLRNNKKLVDYICS